MACCQRIQFSEELAPLLLPLLGDALGNDAFDHERSFRRVAARGEGLESRSQEPRFGESALRLRHHDVGWNQALVSGVIAVEQRNHGADARIHVLAAGLPRGLNHVGRGLVAVVAVGHAADQGILVRVLAPTAAAIRRCGFRPHWWRSGSSAARCSRSRRPASGQRCRCGTRRPTARLESPTWPWRWPSLRPLRLGRWPSDSCRPAIRPRPAGHAERPRAARSARPSRLRQ